MNSILREAFLVAIRSLTDTAFQDFIEKLYSLLYGKDFLPIRQKKDKGCDGILNDDTILAVYAPETYTLAAFKKKCGDDFDGYKDNWQAKYPKWRVIYNGELQANAQQYLTTLKEDVEIEVRDQILLTISQMDWPKKREVAEYLKVNEQFLINDALEQIIDDLTNEDVSTGIKYSKPMYMPDKVALNFSKEDTNTILSEYESYLGYFEALKGVLAANEERLTNLKAKICTDYLKYTGTCKDRLSQMTEAYTARRNQDDLYKKMIRVVLIYFFEQCLIGQKTDQEL